MRWKVEGADPVTGSDQLLSIEALTAEEAERQARYNGLLVSKVYPANPRRTDMPVLVYASPASRTGHTAVQAPPEAASPALPVTPEYRQIVWGARWLSRLGLLAFGLSALAAVASLGAFTLLARRALRDHAAGDAPDYLAAALWLLAAGGAGCVAAVLLRTLAAVALAVRDIARNSHGRRG